MPKCPVCAEEEYRLLLERDNLKLVSCNGCNLAYINSLNSSFDAAEYDYYRNRIEVPKEELYDPITEKRYEDLFRKIESYRKSNEILDVGCGEGHFLWVAERMNWRCMGIDQAPYAVEICKRLGLNVIQADLLKLDLKKDYYDIIAMFEVIEHLAQPKECLLKTKELLRKGGICILTTPNFNCLTRRLLKEKSSLISKQHLTYFTPKTIASLLRKCGFRIIELRTSNITLPELRKIFRKNIKDRGYACNQKIRKFIEVNPPLSLLKDITNYFLNLTRLGEQIFCICQK